MGLLRILQNWLGRQPSRPDLPLPGAPAKRPLVEPRPLSAGVISAARSAFHQQRERLEARFFDLAAASGKPRHLRWTRCDFEDDVAYAQDRNSGQLRAFVAVTIGFEAIEGGLMEDVEAVQNLRAATAAFHYDGKNWATEGRTIFNLSPDQAIAHFQELLAPLSVPGAE